MKRHILLSLFVLAAAPTAYADTPLVVVNGQVRTLAAGECVQPGEGSGTGTAAIPMVISSGLVQQLPSGHTLTQGTGGTCTPVPPLVVVNGIMQRATASMSVAGVQDTILVEGQSNALGQEKTSDITWTQRAQVGTAFAGVPFRQYSVQTRADPLVFTTNYTGSLASVPSSVANNSGCTSGCMGPSQALGRHVHYFDGGRFQEATFGVSGTSGADWAPTGSFPTGTNLFAQGLNFAKAYRVSAIVWIQGETDATDVTLAGNYQTNLTAILQGFRAQFPGVPIIVNELSTSNTAANTATVRSAEAAVCGPIVTGCTLVDYTPSSALGADHVHYTADGYNGLGDELAAAIVDAFAFASPVSWAIDRRSLIGMPNSATQWSAVMTAASISSGNPSTTWLMQEASGNLSDSIGGITLTASGSSISYAQANLALTHKLIQFATVAAGQFASTSASLPDPSTTSWARYAVSIFVAPAATRNLWVLGTAGFGSLETTASPLGWGISSGGNFTQGVNNPNGSLPRPFIDEEKPTATSAAIAYDDLEKLTGTKGAITGKSVTIGQSGFNDQFASHTYIADFWGTAAEKTTTEWRSMLQTLNWGNANLGATAIPW